MRQFFSISRICEKKCPKPKIFLAFLSKLFFLALVYSLHTRGVGTGGQVPQVFSRHNKCSVSLYLVRVKLCLKLKSNSGRRNFNKFTKILLKKFTNYGKLYRKLVKNTMSGNFLPLPPPPPAH